MSDCPYPQYFQPDERRRCTSIICPAREDCPGIDEAEAVSPLAELEQKLAAMHREIIELQIEVRRLRRHEADVMATYSRIAEGMDDGRE